MKNLAGFGICVVFLLLRGTVLLSQVPVNEVLVSSAVDCQNTITRLTEEIKKYELKIVKSQNTIGRSETIQKNARDAGNREAERIATEAISNSQKTISDCREFIVVLKERRGKYQSALESVRKAMGKTNKVNAVTLNFSGQVSIIRPSGEKTDMNNTTGNTMEAGDIISTSSDGIIDLAFLEGRGKVTVGPDSKVRMIKEKDSTNVLEVIKGKIYSSVLKADEYEKKMIDLYKNFKTDSLLKTMGTVSSFSEEQWYAFVRKSMSARMKKKFEVRTPAAVLAVRGTRFSVNAIDENTTELTVIEGKVEFMPAGTTEGVMVEGGQVCRINKKEPVTGAVSCDTLKINKWWQYEK
jgi:hypothetical protein